MAITVTAKHKVAIKAAITNGLKHQRERWKCDGDYHGFTDKPDMWMAVLRGDYWRRNTIDDYVPRRTNNQVLPKLRAKQDILTLGVTEFFVEPQQEQFETTVESAGALLNTTWASQRLDNVCERCRWDADIYGFGVVEVGWRFKRRSEHGYETHEGERGSAYVPEDASPIVMLPGGDLSMDQGVQEYESEAAAQEAARQQQIEQDSEAWGDPQVDDPFVERICPRNFIVDPNACAWDLSDAQYAFRIRFQSPERLRRDKRLSNTKTLKGTVYSVHDINESVTSRAIHDIDKSGDVALCKLYDGYMWLDVGNDERFVRVIKCDEVDEPLLVSDNPYEDEDGSPAFPGSPFPFVVHPGIVADNDAFYPESAVAQVVDLQLGYDESFNTLNEHRRKSPDITMGPEGVLDANQIAKLEAGIPGTFLEVQAGLADKIALWPHAEPQMDLYNSLEQLPIEIGRQLGVSQFEESIIPGKDMRAREVDAVQQSGNSRTNGDARRYREFREAIGLRLLILFQIFGDRSRPYWHQGADGQRQWGVVRNADLRGQTSDGTPHKVGIQHIVKVNADSVNASNRSYDQQLKMKLLEIVGQFANVQDEFTGKPMVNIKAMLRLVVRAFDERDLDALVPPDPSPEEQQQIMAQREAEAQAQQASEQEQAQAQQAQEAEAQRGGKQEAGVQHATQVAKLMREVSQLHPELQQQFAAMLNGNGGQQNS